MMNKQTVPFCEIIVPDVSPMRAERLTSQTEDLNRSAMKNVTPRRGSSRIHARIKRSRKHIYAIRESRVKSDATERPLAIV